MYAVIRELIYDESRLSQSGELLREFQRLHAAQPGFIGNLTVEIGLGHQIVVNLWQTEEQSDAGREALGPAVRRIQEPLMTAPSRLIGAGPIVYNDIVK